MVMFHSIQHNHLMHTCSFVHVYLLVDKFHFLPNHLMHTLINYPNKYIYRCYMYMYVVVMFHNVLSCTVSVVVQVKPALLA